MSEFNESNVIEITEMLKTATKNVEKVYDSGYDEGLDAGKALGGYSEGYDAGKKAEYDAFWDAYQPTTALFPYQFTSAAWNDNSFFPKKDIIAKGNVFGGFYGIGVTDLAKRLNECRVTLDTSTATNMGAFFQYSSSITTIPKISCKSATNIGSAFHSCYVLKTIECLEVHENLTYNATFGYCNNLENITFEGIIGQDLDIQWCTKLTWASIESIVNHLSDTTTGKTLTLSKVAVDEGFYGYGAYVDENNDVIWTDVVGSLSMDWSNLIATKSNWTITLV